MALKGLTQFAEDLKYARNIFHEDVIDAMFRQPFSSETKPFREHLIKTNPVVSLSAVDYDLGVNGSAYFDTDTADYHVSTQQNGIGNRGRMYRNDGVDIGQHEAPQEGYFVGHIADGEWLQYTVNVAAAGNYTLRFRVAAEAAGGRISLQSNGRALVSGLSVPATGGWLKFKDVDVKNVPLKKGIQQLKVYMNTGGFNFDSIQFIK
ncbi:carbohydrate-binding protein [Pedobacter sp. BAL39]|uniref:carbohydrate-binding protein n=1 Tax=Pedobacter sp. BAL39 TaxID=391596 RepID=UPI0002DAB454|nr:carbohydrate-binding protein [Pedobacter sp. BAL39]